MARTKQQQPESNPSLSIKSVTKSSVWDIQENDVFRMWEAACKDAEVKENVKHYIQVFKSAFFIEDLRDDSAPIRKSYEARGYKVATIKFDDNMKFIWAIKKRPISRVTDLTYENIRHISATQLLEVIDRNFGGGWESLSQNVRDIIESGFDVSTTTLPADRLKKKGGLYDKMVNDGYEVLEIAQGTWVEAIFVKQKPESEIPVAKIEEKESFTSKFGDEDDDEDADLPEIEDNYGDDDDDDEFDEDKLTEESYRTTFDADPEDFDLSAADVSDDDDY